MTAPTGPGSRWRQPGGHAAGSDRPRGSADRVPRAQHQARQALALAGAFLVAAVAATALPHDTGRWLPLHLLLAGALVAAISGVSVLFAVTWSAAPAPSSRVLAAQRALVGSGAAGVAAARELDAPTAVLAVTAALFLGGLALLGVVLVVTVARGVERRFDVAVAWYVVALAAGIAAGALGAVLGAGTGPAGTRPAHVTLNLLGLIGLVVAGTLPTFASTVGRTRLSARATPDRLIALLVWQATATTAAAGGLLAGWPGLAAAGLGGYAAGLAALLLVLPPLRRRSLTWAGPRLLALWAGIAWWAAAVTSTAVEVAGGRDPFTGRWLLVLVVAGFVQILWASLAYLLPVLRGGGHEQLGRGFAATRSWVGLAAANAAGLALASGIDGPVVAVALAVWIGDAAVRLGRFARPSPAAHPVGGRTR